MTKSMTAFSHKAETDGGLVLSWDIRTVNHRHLDISLHLPDVIKPYEHQLIESIRKKLDRGRVDLKLTVQSVEQQTQHVININESMVKSLLAASSKLKHLTHKSATLSTMEILQWPGVIENDPNIHHEYLGQAQALLDIALDDLIVMREAEGERLQAMVQTRCNSIKSIVKAVKERRREVIKALREKVVSKISELDVTVDASRLEQELVYHAQRLDVDEELDRLNAHIEEINSVFERNEPIGKRLGFLMQELSREANTLASKSNDTETTKASVELKVLIEQMREQCLNIE